MEQYVSRAAVAVIVVLLAASCCCAQGPVMTEVTYDEQGFKVRIPSPFERHQLPDQPEGEVFDVYTHGDFVYVIRLAAAPENTLASTFIEKAIQDQVSKASALGEVTRWELDLGKRGFYKGFSGLMNVDEAMLKVAPYLQKLSEGNPAGASACLRPLEDESSPVISVGAMGPREKAQDIEVAAKIIACNVYPITPEDNGAKQEPSAVVRPALKKTDIQLTGVIGKLAPDTGSLLLLVEQIRLRDGEPQKLDPPREKTVFFDELPEGALDDVRILVIGKNEGVGKPIRADYIEILPGKSED